MQFAKIGEKVESGELKLMQHTICPEKYAAPNVFDPKQIW
jgi:hypothetical protein